MFTQHDTEEYDSVLNGPRCNTPASGNGHGTRYEADGLGQGEFLLVGILTWKKK